MTSLGDGADGIVVDAALDALDDGEHHQPTPCRRRRRKTCGRLRRPGAGAAAILLRTWPRSPHQLRRRVTPSSIGRPIATAIYAVVAGLLLLRLVIGIHLTWRLVRAARPIGEPWTAGCGCAREPRSHGPVTFGSTILLPPQCDRLGFAEAPRPCLRMRAPTSPTAISIILLLASLNRAVFWFSPFAWWHSIRLGRACRDHQRRPGARSSRRQALSYAEILLDLVQRVRTRAGGAGNGEGEHGRHARGAHSRHRPHAPAKLGWRQANLDCRSHPAGGGRLCRQRSPTACRRNPSLPSKVRR